MQRHVIQLASYGTDEVLSLLPIAAAHRGKIISVLGLCILSNTYVEDFNDWLSLCLLLRIKLTACVQCSP